MLQSTISMLRTKDARRSEAFYCGLLGFEKSWEYDPGAGYPIFLEVSRDQVAFHLSEHEGDGPLEVQVYINVEDAEALHQELVSRGTPVKDALHEAEWGHLVFSVEDPDGNTLRFGSPL